jgi:hypothetical protein
MINLKSGRFPANNTYAERAVNSRCRTRSRSSCQRSRCPSVRPAAPRSAAQALRAQAALPSAGSLVSQNAPHPTAATPSPATPARLPPPMCAAPQQPGRPARPASRRSPVAARAAASQDRARTTRRTHAHSSRAHAGKAASGRIAAPRDIHRRAACATPRSVQSPSQRAAFSSQGTCSAAMCRGSGLRGKRREPAPYRDTSERSRQRPWPNQAMRRAIMMSDMMSELYILPTQPGLPVGARQVLPARRAR